MFPSLWYQQQWCRCICLMFMDVCYQLEILCDGLIQLENSDGQKCGPNINMFCGNW